MAVDVVVLTALALEHEAVRAHLTGVHTQTDSHGTSYDIGIVRGGEVRVALCVIGQGNPGAAVLAGQAIDELRPKALFFVGVAGGLKDVEVGDVVVATRIHSYQTGKDTDGGERSRSKSWPVSHRMVQLAHRVARQEPTVKVHFGPLVSGEKVIDTRGSRDAQKIAEQYSDALAIDMESAGTAEGAFLKDFQHVLVIRGISDLADGNKGETDRGGSQPRAAARAAAFAMALAGEVGRTVITLWAPRPTATVLMRRLAIGLALGFLTVAALSYGTLLLGYGEFYTEIGAGDAGLPTPPAPILPALGLAFGFVVIGAVMLAFFVVGGMIAPRRLDGLGLIPASALGTLLPSGAFIIMVAKADNSVTVLVTVLVLEPLCFGYLTPLNRGPWQSAAGIASGFVTVFGITMAVRPLAGWLPWYVRTFDLFCFLHAAAAVGFGVWWWAMARRRKQKDNHKPEESSPLALLRELFGPSPAVIVRERIPVHQAKLTVTVTIVGVVSMGLIAAWGALEFLYGRVEAAQSAVELGYLPADKESPVIRTPVRPVTIALQRAGDDPQAVCQRPARAASWLAGDGESNWVLLRTIGAPQERVVLRLRETDYAVRPVSEQSPPAGPWVTPACAF